MTHPHRPALEPLESRAYLSGSPTPLLAVTVPQGPDFRDMTTDRSGNVYLSGSYDDKTDFNPLRRKTYHLPGAAGTFVAKYTARGALVWARGLEFDGNSAAVINAIAVSPSGSVFAAGYLHGAADFDSGSADRTVTAGTDSDTFVWKLDHRGRFVYATAHDLSGVNEFDQAADLTIDRSGNALIAGTVVTHTTIGVATAIAAKFDQAGGLLWNRDMGRGAGQAIAVDANGQPVVATASTSLTVTKFTRRGRVVWQRSGPTLTDTTGLAIDREGNTYLSENFGGTFKFDAGNRQLDLPARSPQRDSVILKLDPGGELLWARQLSSTSSVTALSLDLDRDGYVHVAGAFLGHADLDPGPGTFDVDSGGIRQDAFVVKLDHRGRFARGNVFGDVDRNDQFPIVAASASGRVYAHVFLEPLSARTRRSGVFIYQLE